MTRQPAAPAMTTLVEVTLPDAPNGAVSVVVRLRVGALEEVTGGVRIEVLEAVRIEAVRIEEVTGGVRIEVLEAVRIEAVRIEAARIEEVTGGVRIEVLKAAQIEAVPIATASAADRCSRPGNRGCQSRRSPMT